MGTKISPFVYGSVVEGSNYCGRRKDEKAFKLLLQSGQNVFVQGQRRTGKTSFILNAAKSVFKKHIVCVDCYGVKTSQDFVERVVGAYVSYKKQNSLISDLSGVKLEFSAGIVKASLTSDSDPVPHLKIIENLRGSKVMLFFDEFQELMAIEDSSEKLIASLRAQIQHLPNTVVFSGSDRNKMDSIFLDHDSPFYQGATPFKLSLIEEETFFKFIDTKFKSGRFVMTDSFWTELKNVTGLVPGYVQHLCFITWTFTQTKNLSDVECRKAIAVIHELERSHYELHLANLTSLQSKVLIQLAKTPKAPTSQDFLKAVRSRSPASIKRAIQALIQRRLIWHEVDYRFESPFFQEWLKQQ